MSERVPKKSQDRSNETLEEQKGRRFIYHYLAPIAIAGGLLIGGTSAVDEAKRIADGQFNETPPALKSDEESKNDPGWWFDAFLLLASGSGFALTTGGVILRRTTRDKE